MTDTTTEHAPGPVTPRGTEPGPPQETGRDDFDPGSGNWPLALSAAVVGTFLSIIDVTIVNVGIPSIQTQFGASTTDVQWISTAFSLTLGITIPASGWIGTRFGLSRVYLWSLVAFAVASVLCGLAWDLPSLILFRILQAVPGAIIPTVTLSIIQRIVPPEKAAMGTGVWGVSAVLAPAVGPALGGFLIDYSDWRMLFFINLPFAFLAIGLGIMSLPEFPASHTSRFDIWGFGTIASGLFALLLALSQGPDWGWGGYRILGLLTLSVLFLALFVVVELEVDEPLLDPRFFRQWTFTNAQILTAILSGGYFAVLFYAPLFLQEGLNVTPLNAGLVMVPEGLAMAVGVTIGGAMYEKMGPRVPCLLGFSITLGAAFLMCHITPEISRWHLAWLIALRGLGYGIAVLPAITDGIVAIPPEKKDSANAFINLIWRVTGALIVGSLNAIATTNSAQLMADRSSLLDLPVSSADPRDLLPYYERLQVDVMAHVVSNLFLIIAAVTALGLLFALTLRGGPGTTNQSDRSTELAL